MTQIPLKRYGGKAVIAKWIVPLLPPHTIYVEPFCGSAAILFAKAPSEVEVINDLDARLINAFRMIRSKPDLLAALLWATPLSPIDLQDENNKSLVSEDPLEDARIFIAQSEQFFSSPHENGSWAIKEGSLTKAWMRWWTRIKPAAERLRRVQILQKDAIELIERFDKYKDVLFYVDPPYIGHEHEYAIKTDYDRLAEVLKKSKNKVMVSDFKERESVWKGWRVLSQKFARTAGNPESGKKGVNEEYLFLNFDPMEKPKRRRLGLCSINSTGS